MKISLQPLSGHTLGWLDTRAPSRPYVQPVMLAVIWFNFVLCFINTRHWLAVSGAQVALIQIVLLVAAGALGRSRLSHALVAYATLVVGTVLGLKLANPAIDLKILFDMAVGPAFMLLGTQVTTAQAHIILRNMLICVVAVGLVEMFFTTWYESVINIWSYYISKGTVAENTTNFTGTSFFVSGERSEQAGRSLLGGILSAHRAGSVFLEPVSMGNFPIVCFAWLLSARLPGRKLTVLLFALTVACIVLPDSRFSSVCCILMVLFRFTGLQRSAVLAASMPILVMVAMWFVGSIAIRPEEHPHILADDLGGRLLFSSKLLAYLTPANWLGLSPSPIYTADTGYAYLASNLGLPLTIVIWLGFAFAPALSTEAATMRGMIAVYYSTSLAINSSLFSIKTAAVLWFLYGATQAHGAARHFVRLQAIQARSADA